MSVRTELLVLGGEEGYVLVVEPWAFEFAVSPHERCKLVAIDRRQSITFAVERLRNYLIVWFETGGDSFEFWRGQDKVFDLE